MSRLEPICKQQDFLEFTVKSKACSSHSITFNNNIIIKTCSASGAPYHRFGALPPNPTPGALPLDPAGDFRPPGPLITSRPAFQFPPGSSGSRRNTDWHSTVLGLEGFQLLIVVGHRP